jgi:hypothetical protein
MNENQHAERVKPLPLAGRLRGAVVMILALLLGLVLGDRELLDEEREADLRERAARLKPDVRVWLALATVRAALALDAVSRAIDDGE